MSTDTSAGGDPDTPARAGLAARVEELEESLAEVEAADDGEKMSIVATKGTLDMASPH